jgi:hypothetical protein
MQLIKAVDAKLGNIIAMPVTVHTGVVQMVMGKLVSRTFEDVDGWITLTIETKAGKVAHDYPFDDLIVKEV